MTARAAAGLAGFAPDARPATAGGGRDVAAPRLATSTRTERLAEALERARAGDTGGLDEIVRELTPLLWHVARSQGVDRADVADVVQHSWLELVSRLDGIRSPSALTAWLVTTTKREAWRLNRRRQTPVDPTTLVDVEAEVPDPASGLIEDERDRVLWRRSSSCPTGAASCCASSRWSSGPTTRWSARRSGCRTAASARPADGAWPSCGRCCSPTPPGGHREHVRTRRRRHGGGRRHARRPRRRRPRPSRRPARPARRSAPGFTDLMVFAVAAHGLEVELARLEEGALAARAGEEATRSMTFEADSLSILLRVVDAGEDRVRLDGWLAPAVRAVVELRRPGGGADRGSTGDDGRFVLDGVRRGAGPGGRAAGSGAGRVVTPTVEL